MDCANTQKLKTSKVTYRNKALTLVTTMPSYQETVTESWYCCNKARIHFKPKEGNPQVEVMDTINLNLQHSGSTFPPIFTDHDLLTLHFICAKTFLNT